MDMGKISVCQDGFALKKEGDFINLSGKKIIMLVAWFAVIFAFLKGSIILGIIALSLGFVLKKDYDERKLGLTLIIMGIVSGLSGPILGSYIIWYMSNH